MRTYRPIVLAAFGAAFLLAGCSAGGLTASGATAAADIAEAETEQERKVLTTIARDDLAEALRSAEAHNDIIAATCWRGLLVKLDSVDGGFFTEPKGVFSTFQKTRNIRRVLTEGVSDELKVACAALRSDTRSAVLDIARTVGLPIPGIF